MIARLGETELNALLEGYQYTTFTPATLASREALMTALTQTREQGYAWTAKRTSRACAAWRCQCGTTNPASSPP